MKKVVLGPLSIRTKLVAAFLITVIPVVLLGIISLNNTGRTIYSIATRSAVQSLDISTNYVNLLFESVENTSVQIIENKNIEDYLKTDPANQGSEGKSISEYLQNIINNSNMIADIVIIPANGKSVSTSGYDPALLTFEKAKKDAIIKKCMKLNGGTAWAGIHSELDTAKTAKGRQFSIAAAKTIKSNNSAEPNAVIVIDIKLDSIEALLKNAHTSTTGTTHLISPDGKDIAFMPDGFNKVVLADNSFTSQPFFKKIKNGASLKGSSEISYGNEKHFLAFSRVGTTNYLLINTIPYSELNAASNTIAITTTALTALAVLTSVILGFIISISMVKEIRHMLAMANAAAEGDLTVICKTRRRDELGILSAKLTEMICNMRSLISQTAGVMSVVNEYAVKLSGSSSNISSSSLEISAAMQQITTCLTMQAKEIEESNTEITGLAGMISKSSENSDIMQTISEESGTNIKSGLSSIEYLESTSRETVNCTKKVLQGINILDEKSKSIDTIVQAITMVADQTKLLALNAAIEAARAGEDGLGFSVIAAEVGRLSEKALASTGEVEKIVADIQSMIDNVVFDTGSIVKSMKSQDAALLNAVNSFKSISSHMEAFSGKSSEIKDALTEMNRKKESTISNITRISANSQEAAASSEEVAAAVEEQTGWLEILAGQANEMRLSADKLSGIINTFKM